MKPVFLIGRNFKIPIDNIRIIKESKFFTLLYNFNVTSGIYDKYSYIPLDIPQIYDEEDVLNYVNLATNNELIHPINVNLLIFTYYIQAYRPYEILIDTIVNDDELYIDIIRKIKIKK